MMHSGLLMSCATPPASKPTDARCADWTSRDDEITRELARFNRNGVPLYVLYGGGTTQVLPELLTERIVLDALGRL